MKTAMQELIEYIELYQPKNKITDGIWSKAKSLLEKEKEQIKDAFNCGIANGADDSEQYFEETFKNQKI